MQARVPCSRMFLAAALSTAACGAPPAAPRAAAFGTESSSPSQEPSAASPPPSLEGSSSDSKQPLPGSDTSLSDDASTGAASAEFACGPYTCRRYATSEEAFLAVISAENPRVLGVGEAHARATSRVPSATRRFTEELLPTIADRTHSLVVELLAPNAACQKETNAVREQQEPVTREQASTNQNEFVSLGERARSLGIVPYLLRPSCADLDAITRAGENDVWVMLETIARLTTAQVERLLASSNEAPSRRLVIAYGGAVHNDLEPRPARETWSYGPALANHLEESNAGPYVELDLIVPELAQDNDAWRAQPWYGHYDAAAAQGHAQTLRLGPRRWVLFFPSSPPALEGTSPPTTR